MTSKQPNQAAADDDDYGAELDAMVQETEQKIDKKDKKQEAKAGKKSFL